MVREVRCLKCGYTWTTKSKLLYVTCPNCQHKVKTHSNGESL